MFIDQTHPKIIDTAFSFPEFVPARKKLVYSIHPFIFDIQSILESGDQTGHTHFDHAHTKIFDQLLDFEESTSKKNQFIPPVHSSDTVNFRVLSPD